MSEIYGEAMAAFRHYDTLSTTVVGAIPLVFVGVLGLLHTFDAATWRGIVPMSGAILTEVLFQIYSRLDMHAATALKVAACLESGGNSGGNSVMGLASVRERIDDYPDLKSKADGRIFTMVCLLSRASLIIQLALVLMWIFALWFGKGLI